MHTDDTRTPPALPVMPEGSLRGDLGAEVNIKPAASPRAVRIRTGFIVIPLLLVFGALGARLTHIQVLDAERWDKAGRLQRLRGERQPGFRGTITFYDGETIACSMPSDILIADLKLLKDPVEAAEKLSPLLGVEESKLASRMRREDVRVVYLSRNVPPETVEKIRELKVRGIGFEGSSRRVYPSETLGCHVVGWSGLDGGQEGIELRLDSLLRGVSGYHRSECDAARRTISRGDGPRHTSLSQPARPGLTIRLTVHAGIQHVAEAELKRIHEKFKPQAAVALVMDVGTGAVLAMASSPSFDPNEPAKSKASARRNRTLTDQFEPGSIFKAFIAASALDHGLYSRNSRFFCENGAWRRGYRVLHDSHAYGYLTFDEVIIKSSNIGAAKMGLRLGKQRVYQCVKDFGFGDLTRIDLTGEARGRVRPLYKWRKDSLLSVPMGQEIAVTPLQMVCAYSALLNGGVLLRPQIVSEITNHRGEELYRMRAQPVRRVISTRTSRAMRSILHRTVVKGTGRRAWCREYAIGGKTGTAQKVINGRYSHEKYVASFCGFAPVESPRLVCLVAVDAPEKRLGYYGGTVSAPAVRTILRRGLNALGVQPRSPSEQDKAEKIFKKRGG